MWRSIKTKIILLVINLCLCAIVQAHDTGCSNLYGHEPCRYVPAPPGKTPPCARPGQTYCEFPEHYPSQLIGYLVDKWRFDHRTLLSDETRDDFQAYYPPPPKGQYGPPGYQSFGPNIEPIYIPKPPYPSFNEGQFNATKSVYEQQLTNGQLYTSKNEQNFPNLNRPDYNGLYDSYLGNLWKRRIENKYNRSKRDLRYKRSNPDGYIKSTLSRSKRQSTLRGQTLCQTRASFVTPRAALNKNGNWMYVVNMPDANKYTQMVKSETCVSSTCSSLCMLPLGYSSRCEQKYVQKRLVALDGGGNNLYTDLFWFPSCCVCTLSNS